MLISGSQISSSLFSQLTASSTSSTSATASSKNPFDAALSGLMSSIKSGNTSDAEKYLAQLEKLTPANADSSSPLGEFLTSVSSALSTGDISAAQTALTTLKAASAPSSSSTSSATDSSSSTGISQLGTDVLNLFGSISSGNVSGAQSAYDALSSLLLSSDSSTTSTSSSATSSSSGNDSFTKLLSQIGSALSTGDISTAQTALDGFLKSLSSGSLVNASA